MCIFICVSIFSSMEFSGVNEECWIQDFEVALRTVIYLYIYFYEIHEMENVYKKNILFVSCGGPGLSY